MASCSLPQNAFHSSAASCGESLSEADSQFANEALGLLDASSLLALLLSGADRLILSSAKVGGIPFACPASEWDSSTRLLLDFLAPTSFASQ